MNVKKTFIRPKVLLGTSSILPENHIRDTPENLVQAHWVCALYLFSFFAKLKSLNLAMQIEKSLINKKKKCQK